MKAKLLLLTAQSPFPTTSGGATRIYHTIKYLSRDFRIYCLAFGSAITAPEELAFMDKYCAYWQVLPLAKRQFFSHLPYYISCWRSSAYTQALQSLLSAHQFAVIRVEFTQLAYLYDYLSAGSRRVCVAHDVSTVSYARRAISERQFIRHLYARVNHAQIKPYERHYLPLYDEVLAMSETDAQILRQQCAVSHVCVQPNGIAQLDFLPPPPASTTLRLGFIGSPTHPPNRTALEFLMHVLMPALDQGALPSQLVLAGDGHTLATTPSIINLGRVATARDFFAQIDVLVAPLFAGSGTRIKILEALSFGVPVITTTIGAEGLTFKTDFLTVLDNRQSTTQLTCQFISCLCDQRLLSLRHDVAKLADLRQQLQPYLWSHIFSSSCPMH